MGEHLSFKVLGPLMVSAGESAVPIGGGRQRTILALLLLTPGRVVPVDTMVDAVWNSHPPSTARTQVAICVAALRKLFRAAGLTHDVIVTAHPGYVLTTEEHRFDSVDFTQLVRQAEEAAGEGELTEAAQSYTQALRLWRGPAFTGVGGHLVEDEAARLEEHRLNAYDDSTLVQLELGRHQELVPELAGMVREHPLRERTRYHLMLAQYRSGRRADALETYRDAREQFIDELGIEPGPDLNGLHDAILRDDPALTPAASAEERRPSKMPAAVPSELPPDVPAFTGRTEELAALDGLLTADNASTTGLITGASGTGKSGLAMRWAFRSAEHFPDGQLFADLRGYDEHREPVQAMEVLSRFLRSLGVPGEQIPGELEERVALYRSLLADRRVLVVLDSARGYAQIRPLLPGGRQCCVLVTSRDQMEELVTWPAQARVHLGLLSEEEAVQLLTTIVGERRIVPARADAARLVELCDRLPLALRIAAARLASKPHWTVRYLVNRLSDEHKRLDELSQGEAQVRAGLALSYRYLSEEAARLLRRLGLLDVPDFTAWAGAALLDQDVQEAERIVEDLVDAQFLEVVNVDATGSLRYRFHTLVRLYAAERARAEETEPDLRAATGRFLRTLLTLAEEAELREGAGRSTWARSGVERRDVDPALLDDLLATPLEWFEAERLALVASVHQAARTGEAELAWELTVRASVFFGTRSYTEDWRDCGRTALEAAQLAGDLKGQGAMNFALGTLELVYSRLESAETYLEEALLRYTEAGEVQGRGMALRSLGQTERLRGRPDAGMTRFAEALSIFRTVGDPFGEVHVLHNMAEAELDRGRLDEASGFAVEALRLEEARGADTRNLAQALYRLGLVRLAQGRPDQAEESFLRAVRIVKEKADMIGLAHVLLGLAETRLARGELALARTTLVDALEIAEDCRGLLLAARIGMVLGEVLRRTGQPEAARAALFTARERFAAAGASGPERQAEEALGSLVA